MSSPRHNDKHRANSVDPDEYRDANDTVDPYLRAHVHSLVAALGGPSPVKGGGYVLGDEAQYVLRDLKKWLRAYDEKLNRLDVARCLAESKLVGNDLVEILASWPEDKVEDRRWYRLALSCLELLVPLTWPLERREEMTVNHHRHITYLEYAQTGYKRAILHHRSRKVLKNCVKIALPSLAVPLKERESRDDNIIRLVLYFLRNIAAIRHPDPTEDDTGEDIGRDATIKAFEKDNVLHLMLAISSGMGEDFNVQDVPVSEILFHLLKGVNMKELFMTETQLANKEKENLASLLALEKGMDIARNRDGPTRHNRFGTQIMLTRENGKTATISGQDVLASKEKGLQKIDSSKKWRKPKGGKRQSHEDVYVPVHLSTSAKKIMREFVENFIDAGFNPLFHHIRKDIARDEDRFATSHVRVFFYLVAWFLEAERMRREAALRDNPKEVADSFSIIASVMNQETLIIIQKHMKKWWELKMWSELESVMKCFTQILLTVQDMAASPFEEDQEIAENIQSRIFYEESTLDLVHTILRGYTTQTFDYLNIITELTHVHTKMLERYSKQNTHMFVRAKKSKSSKKKKDATDKNDDSEPEIQQENSTALKEKAFDFKRFEAKLLNNSSVDSFVTFLSYYKELDYSQIKRALSFFHRVFVKRKMEIALYRLDIVELFYRIMQDSEGLPPTHPAYKELDQFTKYLIKCLVRKLQTTPCLYVELLFSKIPKTAYYLMHGRDQEIETRAAATRAAAIFHVKGNMPHDEQIGVTIAALIDENHKDVVEWIRDVLDSAAKERRLWESEREARKLTEAAVNLTAVDDGGAQDAVKDTELPPVIPIQFGTEERKKLLFKNAKLRLLCTLVGAEIQGERDDVNSAWILPNSLSASKLEEYLQTFRKYLEKRIELPEGQTPANLIKRKPAPRKSAHTVSDSESSEEDDDFIVGDSVGESGMGGGAGGEGAGKSREGKSKRKKRAKDGVDGINQGPRKSKGRRERGELNEYELAIEKKLAEERRLKKQKEKDERNAQVKSSMYIDTSDEEYAEVEVEKDKKRRAVLKEKLSMVQDKAPEVQKAIADIYGGSDASEDDNEDAMDVDNAEPTSKRATPKKAPPKRKRATRHPSSDGDEAIGDDQDMADTEDSDSGAPTIQRRKPKVTRKRRTPTPIDDEDEEMEDVSPPKKRIKSTSRRMVSLDSDDSDDQGGEDHNMTTSQKVSPLVMSGSDDDEDSGPVVSKPSARSRAVAMLLSDDEDE